MKTYINNFVCIGFIVVMVLILAFMENDNLQMAFVAVVWFGFMVLHMKVHPYKWRRFYASAYRFMSLFLG